jgi:hypothetical protein
LPEVVLLGTPLRVTAIVISGPIFALAHRQLTGRPGLHPGHPAAKGGLPASKPGLLLALMTCTEFTKPGAAIAKIVTAI